MPNVTVVTICFNAEKEIRGTIESVLDQNYGDFEYLIVDGASKDGTADLARSYEQAFADRKIPFRVISEKDRGIYDALNKGAGLARGEWVIYMNAGDRFFDGDSLDIMFRRDTDGADVLYGDTVMQDRGYYRFWPAADLKVLQQKMPFCHQSVFVRTALMREFAFDLSYPMAADYEAFVRLYQAGKKFAYVNWPVSVYDMTGLSASDPDALSAEMDRIHGTHGLPLQKNWKEKGLVFRLMNLRRKLAKQFLPGVFYSEKRGWTRDLSVIRRECTVGGAE